MIDPELSHYAVLYTDDMEPITVLRLGDMARHTLINRGYVGLEVNEPLNLEPWPRTPEDMFDRVAITRRRLLITAELFIRNGRRHLMLFIDDVDTAKMLRAAFLPGQQRRLKDETAAAFGRGFLAAVRALG